MWKAITHLCLAVCVGWGVGTALAQEAPAEPDPGAEEEGARPKPKVLEEILVTARKKAATEALQDVPIAVSAFTGNFLEENFVEDLTDLGRSAPNVQLSDVGTFPGTANFSIRGNAIFSSIISDEPLVGIFVDGIYAGMNVGAIHDLFELEAVEILRGPQGTLFGRNVTGGAINVRTRRPSGEFGVRGRATLGSHSRSDFALSVEAPISETLAWKVDFLSKDRNGLWDTPFQGGETGHARSWTVRPMLSWQPTETLDIQALFEVMQYDGDTNPVRLAIDGGPNNFTIPAGGTLEDRIYGCQLACIPGFEPDLMTKEQIGEFDLQQDHRGNQGYKVQRFTFEANWDVGPGTLTSISGWRNVDNVTDIDVDGTFLDNFQGRPGAPSTPSLQHQVSTELRYNSPVGERADLTVGGYYFKQDLDYREVRPLVADLLAIVTGNPDAVLIVPARGEMDHQSVAVFGQADYALTDQLTLTGGLRWTWEEKVAVIFPSDTSARGPMCDQDFTSCVRDDRLRSDQDTWNYWSHHLGLRYEVNEDVLLYGTHTRSFRAGGYNLRASALIPFSPYKEERIDAYEVGIKADWWDRRLRTNLVGFYNRGNDIQRTILVDVVQDQKNAAKAHVAGVEAEIWWLPLEGLSLNTTVGWVDAEYDNFVGVCDGLQETGPCSKVFGVPASEIGPGVGRELEFAYIPEWTFSALGRYEFPVPALGDGSLALQTSVYWRDDTWGNDQNTVPIDSYTLWNASISYRDPDDRYTVSVFGKNLLQDPFHDFGIIDVFDARLDWSIGPPRTWGVEVNFRY